MSKIGIAGHGFVGTALNALFTNAVVFDGPKGLGTRESLDDCDYVFLCVPTLLDWEARRFDLSAVYDVLDHLGPKPLVIVKSTVVPGTCRALKAKYEREIVYNPEFLRQATATEDMLNAPHIVVGAESDALCEQIYDLYLATAWMGGMYETDWETAELLKLTKNAYLATKVAFFNMIYAYCETLGVKYDTLKFILNEDHATANSDIYVSPERGFGGACLPKDLNALATAMGDADVDNQVLREVWAYNTRVRPWT